jgi:arginine/lysine/ornithine decarboxylase
MPGHKHGPVDNRLLGQLWGPGLFRSDLSEIGGLDYLHAPRGVLRRAQQLAAAAFGADRTFFLINGSTVGNQASILSTVPAGRKVLLPRASHRSVFGALILADAVPVYIPPRSHPAVDLPLAVDIVAARELARAHPDLAAIQLTSPTYYGSSSDLGAFAQLAQSLRAPLLVDEAHGAHFGFHAALPMGAVQAGADLVVQSTHKTLGSLTQSSMLHYRRGRVDLRRLREVLALLQSSSPSALLVASLDSTRAALATQGEAALGRLISLADEIRAEIRAIPGLWCYGPDLIGRGAVHSFDPTKLLIGVNALGLTGFTAGRWLARRRGIEAELYDFDNVLCSLTVADSMESCSRLVAALRDLSVSCGVSDSVTERPSEMPPWPDLPRLASSPRAAYFAPSRRVELRSAIGQISAEFVIPYPPGIPALVPGEVIDRPTVEYIGRLAAQGGAIIGSADRQLRTIRVVTSSRRADRAGRSPGGRV